MNHRAVDIAEIVLEILDNLSDDHPSLFTAISSNKRWAEEGTNVLWRYPPVRALAGVTNDRRQYYASKTRQLEFDADNGAYHATFRHLRFPGLKTVRIDSYRPADGERLWVEQCLQPNLETFMFFGGPVGELLRAIETSCPNLRQISLDFCHEDHTPQRLLRFVEHQESLRSIDFGTNMDDLLTDELFLHLAITTKTVQAAIRNNQPQVPLQQIRHLDITLHSSAVSILLASAKSLRSVEDSDNDVFQSIGSLHNLLGLQVAFLQPKELSKDEILALRKLEGLQKLTLESYGGTELQAFSLSDEDFTRMFSNFPRLKHLNFEIQSRLTVASTISLGRTCRQLEYLEMLGLYDLRSWGEDEQIMFPQLKVLHLGGIDNMDAEASLPPAHEIEAIASRIIYHAPNLEELYLQNRDPLSKEVIKVFKQRTGNEYNP